MKLDQSCPQCGGRSDVAFTVGDLNRKVTSVQFAYRRCSICGTLWVESPPADLHRYYPDAYFVRARSREQLASWARSEQYKLDIVRRFRTSGHLIEIGPASGSFCLLAQDAAFDVSAIEADPGASHALSGQLGIKVQQSWDEAKALANEAPADVIAMWHVIEHLADPWAMLEASAAKLQPEGILVVATPNPNSLQFRLTGKYWAHVDAPRHLWLIPRKVLIDRARNLGLVARLVTTRDPGSLGWNRFGWERTVQNRLQASTHGRRVSLAGRLASALFRPLDSVQGLGAAYTVVLQKPAT